jgi:hypothetical protein
VGITDSLSLKAVGYFDTVPPTHDWAIQQAVIY